MDILLKDENGMYIRSDGRKTRLPHYDCSNCFLKGCDCECDTCVSCRPRNDITPSAQLDAMNFIHAIGRGNNE